MPITPGYDAHEFFAGEKAVSNALTLKGMRVSSHDLRYSKAMDILRASGFAQQTYVLDRHDIDASV